MPNRQLSAYEKHQLFKYGFDPDLIDDYDEMPVEYITGFVTFRGLELAVDPAVLIPRVETEELVELVVTELLAVSAQHPASVIDIGTGSGAIAISLADALHSRNQLAHIYASDVSPEALAIAKTNARRLIPHQSLTFWHSNLFNAIPATVRFDTIVANLPYIPTAQVIGLESSVQDYEPWLALDGGPLGLDLIHQLLQQAGSRLNPEGVVWLEVDTTHTAELLDPRDDYHVTLYNDSYGRPRFAKLRFR